ncbi:MAG: HAMP domain-containing protein [Desulfobacteraceae bacterium]|nr:HAMP domain-containing protein [Desulfobacteraceae bacterium]MBC2752656.1 HAMP domain-containing protein [Desulfobacteraceae bacterium]
MTKLVQRIAEQTDALGQNHFKYLDILVKFPYVQLSFHQFPSGGQLSTIQEKLELFRVNTESFDRITLLANDGHVVAATPSKNDGGRNKPEMAVNFLVMGKNAYSHKVDLTRENPKIRLYKRVYDYRDPERPVGVVATEVALEKFLIFTQQLDIGEGIRKTVATGDGTVVYHEPRTIKEMRGAKKEFTAHLALLDWDIRVLVPERILLKDVNRLSGRLLAFAAFVAFVAMAVSLAASRIAIKPLVRIIDGIKEFASGNLSYRISSITGIETRRVAVAFNTMAEELQKRQGELIQADKLASLGLLSAGFAHEVRNPLAGIKTSAQVLAKRSSSAETKDLAIGISKEVDRLNKLVGDLLHFSRPKPSHKKPCDLVDIINRALTILDSEIRKKNAKIINKVARHCVNVAPEQLVQVMINLVLNALAAVEPDKGVIRMDSRVSPDNKLTVTLSDNGHGIPEEKITHLFDPFFSLSKEGTGLGLSIVKLLLGNNGVRIDAESVEGEGTTFRMVFKKHSYHSKEVHCG